VASVYPSSAPGGVLFQESWDDANIASRGWYDNTTVTISTAEHIPGSVASAQYRWTAGATVPINGGAQRHKFSPTNSVYVSYWMKYSANYVGSGKPYHPHEFLILTNLNGDFDGPSFDYLTAYIEQNVRTINGVSGGIPRLAIQDGQMIDQTKIGVNLIGVTENRSVAGCNGSYSASGFSNVDCYVQTGVTYVNDTQWDASGAYFHDTNWHFVEAYFQLNSIVNGIGQPDGVLQYWVDGRIVIDHHNVYFRTGANPTMQFNQFVIAPYIGDGSPVDQTFWVDNLTVATARTATSTPAAPTGLVVR